MIRSLRGQIIIGVLTLLVGLVAMFPARVAVNWLPPGVAVSGIEGTIWSGRAEEASVAGVYLRDIEWTNAPLALFTGKLAYSVSATPVSGFLETDLSVAMDQSITLSNLTASLPLNLFASFAGIPGLEGNSSLRFDNLQIVNGMAVAADGELQIANLLVPLAGRDPLGGFRVEFFTQDDGIAASIEDDNGAIDLAGSLTLKADGSYRILAQVVAHQNTPEGIRRQLSYLPPANERGQQELRLEGIL